MKAAIVNTWSQFELMEIDTPAIGAGEALLKVAYTGICHSDVRACQGLNPRAVRPLIAGHEFSAVVAAIDEQARPDIKTGDKVCAHITQSCGECQSCLEGHQNLCRSMKVLGTQIAGSMAEYIKVPVSKLFKLPADADLRLYALVEPLTVGVYTVHESGMQLGDHVFVIGGGPIGLCCALAAKLAGAAQVVISEIQEEKRGLIEGLGFTMLNPLLCDVVAEGKRLSDGKGFRQVFETSGSAAGTAIVASLAAPRAIGMIVGQSTEKMPVSTWDMTVNETQFRTVRTHRQYAFGVAVDIVKSGVIDDALYQLITRDYELRDIQEAFDYCVRERDYIKVMVKVGGDG